MNATFFDFDRRHGRDDPPFAMADQADLLGVDLASSLQIVEAGEHVAGEIFTRRRLDVARRPADSAVVDAQNGHAATGEVIGQDKERLVAEELSSRLALPSQ